MTPVLAPAPSWSFLGADVTYSRFADAQPVNVAWWRGTADALTAIGLPSRATTGGLSSLALGVGRISTDGAFHRPLEPDAATQTRMVGAGSGSTSTQTSAAGRFIIGSSRRRGSTHSLTLEPYGALPYTPADTTTPALDRAEAEFEGALAGKLWSWEYVIGGGYAANDERSTRARTSRTIRNFALGLGGGLARDVPWVAGRAALGVRWREGGETSNDSPNPGALRVFQLSGLSEVEPRDIIGLPPFYQRRRGAVRTLEGAYLRQLWFVTTTLHARRQSHDDRRTTLRSDAPPGDAWHSSLSEYGLTLAARSRSLGTVSVGTESWKSDGEGAVSGLSAVVHRARRNGDRLRSSWVVGDSAARFAGLGVIGERYHDRSSDAAAELFTERKGWRWQMSAAAGAKVRRTATAMLTYDLVLRGEAARVPAGETLGPTFQQWIAPELEYYAAPTRAHTVAAVMLMPIGRQTTWLSLRRWKTFPTVLAGPFTPGGERIITTVSFGLLFGR